MIDRQLLFLLPPSCMVAPIGNIANKLSFSHQNPNSSTMNHSQTSSIPTMLPFGVGMDFQSEQASDNYDEMRGRTLSSNRNVSRNIFMSLTKLSVVYYKRMTTSNLKDNNDPVDSTPNLFYETEQEKAFCVSKAADQQDSTRTKDGNNEIFLTHSIHKESVVNIQLPYDPQAPIELDLWSRSFCPILLRL